MEKLLVVGSGTMGRGIAYVGALGGFQVILNDVSKNNLDHDKAYIETELNRSVEKGLLTHEQVLYALENLNYTTDLESACKDVDIAIEAVFELIEIKIEVFKKLDAFCPEHTILATNTSTMSPTEIAAQTSRPEKCLAMHFFNPVTR